MQNYIVDETSSLLCHTVGNPRAPPTAHSLGKPTKVNQKIIVQFNPFTCFSPWVDSQQVIIKIYKSIFIVTGWGSPQDLKHVDKLNWNITFIYN